MLVFRPRAMPRRTGRLTSREQCPEPFALAGKRGRSQLGSECGDTSIHQSRGGHGDARGLMHQWAMVAPRSFGALVVDLVHRFLASVEQQTGRNGTLSFSNVPGAGASAIANARQRRHQSEALGILAATPTPTAS